MNTHMYVITVAPIVRAASRTLSYFSPVSYPEGAIVSVPVRKHAQHDALVLESRPASSLKTELRSADYTLRKIPEETPSFVAHTTYLKTLIRISRHVAAGIGAVLQTALPRVAFDAPSEKPLEIERGKGFKHYFFQELPEVRHEFFKNLVRHSFARGRSVIILAPRGEKVEYLEDQLSRGIKKHTILLHGGLSRKAQKEAWEEARDHSHPVLIIATPHFLAVPRRDVGTILVEDEGSDIYEAQERPFLDFRYLAREYAHDAGIEYIAADTLVRTETFVSAIPLEGTRHIYPSSATTHLIDMKKHTEENGFTMFAPQTRKALERAESEKMILFVTRRGSYPLTQCSDCGTIVKCEMCTYPLVLYEKRGKNEYRCHMCNRVYDAHIRCHKCQGWKLSLYGIAFDRVRQEIEAEFPDIPLYALEGTPEERQRIAREFEDARSGVLISRASGLPYLRGIVETVAIVSIDPLFAIADIRATEHIARLLFELRARASGRFLIQTRNAEEDVFEYAASGNTEEFFAHEDESRKQFKLPPHVQFVKLRWSGRGAARTRDTIAKMFKEYSPDIYSSFYRTNKGGAIYNALITLPKGTWPDKILAKKLSSLPRSVGVNVDPVSIL